MKKRNWITITIIVAVVIFSLILINNTSAGHVPKSTAICIGENSELYIQLGCHACVAQEEMFGESKEYLNTIDCFYKREKCEGITYTPTWIINGEKYVGVQSIEQLKELTNCN